MTHASTAPRNALHADTDWKAGVWAGLLAGAVFMVLEMAMVWLFLGESPWAPPHMIAAMALGERVLPPAGSWAPLDLGVMIVAILIHFPLAAAYGVVGAWLVHRFDWGVAVAIGAALGLAIYVVNFHFVAPSAFPWFAMARNWVSVFAHVAFGAAAGLAYVGLRKPR